MNKHRKCAIAVNGFNSGYSFAVAIVLALESHFVAAIVAACSTMMSWWFIKQLVIGEK